MRIHEAKMTVAPTEEPVSVAEMKANSRIDHNEEDALLATYIAAARRTCEDISRRAFVTRTYVAKLHRWPGAEYIALPHPPLQSVTSIVYTDENGTPATYSSANYVVDTHSEPGRIWLKADASWPDVTLQVGLPIAITFVAGFGEAEDVPDTYKMAILAYAGAYYENREAFVVSPGLTPISLPFVDSWLMTDRAY